MNERFCPKCGSADVMSDLSPIAMYAGANKMKCNSCGFSGDFFPERELRKDLKKKNKRD